MLLSIMQLVTLYGTAEIISRIDIVSPLPLTIWAGLMAN
jgi:hypothetical protein